MIVKRNDGYHVVAESGKHMGGPYGSRDAANERLRQIEAAKHIAAGLRQFKGPHRSSPNR